MRRSDPLRSPVSIARNHWTDILVPELGQWKPTMRLSVVLPYYERSEELNLTLAGLAQQTYPSHLLQVIVVDDGSPMDPPRPAEDLPFDLQIMTQEDQGYGLARARNFGAKAAEGDLVVFLDCDMIPERQHIEAHARWHHVASRLVTVGFRFHAEFSHVTPSQVAAAVRGGAVRDLVSDQKVQRPEWIEAHMDRTDHLSGFFEDLYLVMSGGNLGIDRDLYWEVGGNDESFRRWGGEDNEFGYRVLQRGAVVVPEQQAIAWHQGEGHEPSSEELHAIWLQHAKMRNLIADGSIRVGSPGRGYSVPRLTVHIDPVGEGAERIGVTVDSVLASNFTDLVIGVGQVSSSDDAEWLRDTYGPDPRVHLEQSESDLEQIHPFASARMVIPAGYGLDADALDEVLSQLGGPGVGAIHITLPGLSPRERMAKLRLTRALNRARSLAADDTDEVAGQLFGERWLSGATSGFWAVEDPDEARARIRRRRGPLRLPALEEELAHTAAQLELKTADLVRLRARRALRLADGLGSLLRARSWTDIRLAFSKIRASVNRIDAKEEVDERHNPGEAAFSG